VGDRMQRAKGKLEETKGSVKKNVGRETGDPELEAKGAGEEFTGKSQNTLGKARSALKRVTR
jgi:uncharacterized protein YjbJ (UPF0337 family)